jgi:hypothetical protein
VLFNRQPPFEAVGWIAAAVDFIIIMATSVLADVGYRWVFLNSGESDERFIGVGLLIFANFSAVAAARGNYQPRNLLTAGRQIREVILAWALVALMLLGVAFSLKIAGTFSRVSTVSLLVVGCALIVLWRVLLSNLIVRALEEGAFAERKIVLIAEKGQLGTSRALVELSRSGYRPTRIFEINRSETDALGVPSSLRATLDEVIELSRRAPIEQLFLLIKWDHARLVEDVLSILRVLPFRSICCPMRTSLGSWRRRCSRSAPPGPPNSSAPRSRSRSRHSSGPSTCSRPALGSSCCPPSCSPRYC